MSSDGVRVETMLDAIDARWASHAADAWLSVDLGVTENDLAALARVPNDKTFRRTLWQAREVFRERTGRQIVIKGGRLIVLAANEQARYAHKQSKKARIKNLRALDVASSVPLEQLPEAERGRHERRIEHMARTIAVEELCSRKRDVLAGLGEQVVASVRQREAEARSRAEAHKRLFGKV